MSLIPFPLIIDILDLVINTKSMSLVGLCSPYLFVSQYFLWKKRPMFMLKLFLIESVTWLWHLMSVCLSVGWSVGLPWFPTRQGREVTVSCSNRSTSFNSLLIQIQNSKISSLRIKLLVSFLPKVLHELIRKVCKLDMLKQSWQVYLAISRSKSTWCPIIKSFLCVCVCLFVCVFWVCLVE